MVIAENGFLYMNNFQNVNVMEFLMHKLGLNQSFINNRMYIGNKYFLSSFIKNTLRELKRNCY